MLVKEHLNHPVKPMYLTQLVHFCRIDIHMDNAGCGAKVFSLPVTRSSKRAPTGSADRTPALRSSPLWCRAFPHAQIVRIIRFNCAQPFQRAGTGIFVAARNSRRAGTACAMPRHRQRTASVFAPLPASGALLDFGMWEIHFVFNGGEPWFQSPLANWISFGISTRTGPGRLSWQRRMLQP